MLNRYTGVLSLNKHIVEVVLAALLTDKNLSVPRLAAPAVFCKKKHCQHGAMP